MVSRGVMEGCCTRGGRHAHDHMMILDRSETLTVKYEKLHKSNFLRFRSPASRPRTSLALFAHVCTTRLSVARPDLRIAPLSLPSESWELLWWLCLWA